MYSPTTTRRRTLGAYLGLTASLLVLGVPSGCGPASSGGLDRVPRGELDQYFVGTVVFRFPDGTERQGRVVEHRTLSPDAEEVVAESHAEGVSGLDRSLRRFRLLEDHRFTLEGEPGVHAGTFEGEPWDWSAWHLRTELPDGSVVVSDDVVGHLPDLHAQPELAEPEAATVMVRRALERVTREEYEARRRALENAPVAPRE